MYDENFYEKFLIKRRRASISLIFYLPILIVFYSMTIASHSPRYEIANFSNKCNATWSIWHGWECDDTSTTMLQWIQIENEYHYFVDYHSTIMIRPRNYAWLGLYIYTLIYSVYFRTINIGIIGILITFGWRLAWLFSPNNPHYNEVLSYCDATSIFLLMAGIVPYFKYIMCIIWDSLVYGFADSVVILIMAINMYLSLACGFNIIYGGVLVGYSTYGLALQQLIAVMFGGFQWEYPLSYRKDFTYILWPIMIIFVSVTLQNVYIAIYARAFSETSRKTRIDNINISAKTSMLKTIKTYVKMYFFELRSTSIPAISGTAEQIISETVGMEIIHKYCDNEHDVNVIVRDIFEQYSKTITVTPRQTVYNYDAFCKKFIKTEKEREINKNTSWLFLLMYATVIVFSYDLFSGDEIKITSELFSLDLLYPMNNNKVIFKNVNCTISGKIFYGTVDGTYSTLTINKGWILMGLIGPTLVVYGAATYIRKSYYMLLMLILVGTQCVVRSVVLWQYNCNSLKLGQYDKLVGALSIFTSSFGLLIIFSENRRVRFLYCVYAYAYSRLRYLVICFCMTIIAFGSSAFILFKYESYSDGLALAFNTITGGNSNFVDRYNSNRNFAIFWYAALSLFGTFVIYNIIIVTIADAYAKATTKVYDTKYARSQLNINFRFPLEFLWFIQYFKKENNAPDNDYYSYLELEFGRENCINFKTNVLDPIINGWPKSLQRCVEAELWLRALEIKHIYLK